MSAITLNPWIIVNEDGDAWDNEQGWGMLVPGEHGSRFTDREKETVNLPMGGRWERDD